MMKYCDYGSRYGFDPASVFNRIKEDWTEWAGSVKARKWIIGISGGIDSTTVTALACAVFGKENVYGVSLPCDGQKDMPDVDRVFNHFGIERYNFDIGDAFTSIVNGVENSAVAVSEQTRINLPARLRMASLYAFAQSLDAIVLNTCNLSESCCSYDTLFGDDCGSYAPIQKLTKTEVRELASYLGVPDELVSKTPVDGLQPKSDEERLGFSYADLDRYIRLGEGDLGLINIFVNRYAAAEWKMKMVTIAGPEFGFPNYFLKR